MWQERDRWRQRVRVIVFVTALMTLVVAWWRVRDDPRSLPSLFSIDTLFGGAPVEPRPAPTPPAPGPPTAAGATPSYRTRGPEMAGGRGASGPRDPVEPRGTREMAAGVLPADAERERPAASDPVRPERTGRERAREGLDCDPDADTAPPSSGGDGLAAQGRPCPDVLPRDPRSGAAVPQ